MANYPEWVLKHKQKGTTIRLVNGKYYLYKVHSVRKPGKNYPVLIQDEFLGVISEEGLIPRKKIQVEISSIEVREYGYSYVIYLLAQRLISKFDLVKGFNSLDLIKAAITYQRIDSYLIDEQDNDILKKIPSNILDNIINQIKAEINKIFPYVKILELCTIYKVKLHDKWYLSRVSDMQQKILDELGINIILN